MGIVVPTVAAASGGVVTAVADDSDTEFIAATALFSIAKDLGSLLNGTDVEISKDEIFDLTFKSEPQPVCAMPSENDLKSTSVTAAGPARLEIPVAGEFDRPSGTLSITHGELKGKTFAGVGPLMEALIKAGYQTDGVNQLRTVLEASFEAFAKRKESELLPLPEPLPRESWETRLDDIKTLVTVEASGQEKIRFTAFVGTQTELEPVRDKTKCREMNDKCVICPDGKIYCTTVAIRKE